MGSNTLILLVMSATTMVLILSVHADVAKKELPEEKVEVVGSYGGGGGGGGGGCMYGCCQRGYNGCQRCCPHPGGGGGGGCMYGCCQRGYNGCQRCCPHPGGGGGGGCHYGCCHWYNSRCQRCCSNANEAKLKAP